MEWVKEVPIAVKFYSPAVIIRGSQWLGPDTREDEYPGSDHLHIWVSGFDQKCEYSSSFA